MKKGISIAFLSAALLILTALPVLPHHHHRDAVCAVMELCETDRAYNDRHTAHDTAGASESPECVADASYAPANVQADAASPDVQAVFQAVAPVLPAPAVMTPQAYGLFIIACASAAPSAGGGLRAPPGLS